MDTSGGKILKFSKSAINLDKEIGSGSFGNVFKATLREGKYPPVAVKIFLKEIRSSVSKQKKKAYEELNKAAMLEHENVVKLIGMVDEEMPWLIFEYMKDGNLLEYVSRKKDIKDKTLVRFARDISNGMAYLHHNNILHKDLAARNILLDGKRAKIADLGLSSILSEKDAGSYALGGKLFPYRHAAVECIIEEIYTFESDVWAFGVLMWEMWTGGRTPYGRDNKQPEVRRFVVEGHNPTDFLQPHCPPCITTVFKSIFQKKREMRPMFEDLTPVFESYLHGTKIQMPVVRSREASPFRGSPPDPNPGRSRSNSNDKILDHRPPGTVSKKSHNLLPQKQLSGDSAMFKHSLTVRGASPLLSSSTPNLISPGGVNSIKIPSHGRNRPPMQREAGIENFHGGSPPGPSVMVHFTPPRQIEGDFGGRRHSDDQKIPDSHRTIGKATSFNNIPSGLRMDSSSRSGSSAGLNGNHSYNHGRLGENTGHGSHSNLELNNENRTVINGFIPNRFGPRR